MDKKNKIKSSLKLRIMYFIVNTIGLIGILGLFISLGFCIWVGLFFGLKLFLTSCLGLLFYKYCILVLKNVKESIEQG